MTALQADLVVVGGGLAGIVTALEALRAGRSVALVDRDSPERFGGLALWAFGGMALVVIAFNVAQPISQLSGTVMRATIGIAQQGVEQLSLRTHLSLQNTVLLAGERLPIRLTNLS